MKLTKRNALYLLFAVIGLLIMLLYFNGCKDDMGTKDEISEVVEEVKTNHAVFRTQDAPLTIEREVLITDLAKANERLKSKKMGQKTNRAKLDARIERLQADTNKYVPKDSVEKLIADTKEYEASTDSVNAENDSTIANHTKLEKVLDQKIEIRDEAIAKDSVSNEKLDKANKKAKRKEKRQKFWIKIKKPFNTFFLVTTVGVAGYGAWKAGMFE